MRRHVHVAAVALTGLGLSAALAPAAFAHVELESSSPRAKSTVRAPSSVVLTFSGPLRKGTLTVSGPGGATASSGKGGRDPRNIDRLRVPLKSGLGAGRYTVKASLVAADGHQQTVTYWFKVKR
jgi:copper resistance protein C